MGVAVADCEMASRYKTPIYSIALAHLCLENHYFTNTNASFKLDKQKVIVTISILHFFSVFK